jgi:positive regulator of sigma E activity
VRAPLVKLRRVLAVWATTSVVLGVLVGWLTARRYDRIQGSGPL